MDEIIHKFEKAGLGRAPFRVVGFEIRRYVPAPGVSFPGAACQYCGTGIVETFTIRDADHKHFVVGNVCVNKTGDEGLINETKRLLNRARREVRHVKDAERIAAAKNFLSDQALVDKLASKPHPYPQHAERGRTLLDFVDWMLRNAGNAGRVKAARIIEEEKPART